MKKITTLSLVCSFFVMLTYAQKKRTCHTMKNLEYRETLDPNLKLRMQKIESFTKLRQTHFGHHHENESIIRIPVVVHILYSKAQENLSEAQITSQIDVLNEDFRRTNADKTNKWPEAADTQIEFYLAKVDPNGNPTNGITRKSTTKTSWGTTDAMKKSSQGGVDAWNTAEYLNMWVCNIGGGILGYAQFPGGDPSTDGVVMGPQYFGSSAKGTGFYLNAPFDKGRTTTHEVGHFLNLRHIWGDGGCGVDDFVADTPESDAPNYNCVTGHSSCGSEDMVQNYMDYSDDACMNLFTLGQKNRMRTILDPGGSRHSLAQSDKTGGGGSCTAVIPTGINAKNVTSSSALISWNNVPGAMYDVRHKKTGSSNWTTKTISGNTITLSGLLATTEYEVQVRSKCPSGNSDFSASVKFTTPVITINYCDSKGNSVKDEFIQKVELGTINNTSDAGGGYSDHTAIKTDLSIGASYTISITPKWNGTVYSEGYGVFIDYNQDGDFSDPEEVVWTKAPSKDTLVKGTFNIPTNAKKGATRMRVILRYNDLPKACGNYNYGETEDYTVTIKAGQTDTEAPTTPKDLVASNIAQTSVTLKWSAATDNVGVTGYDVYRNGNKINHITNTSTVIAGLSAGTTYNFYIKAKDAAGNYSNASKTLKVTTLDKVINYCESKGNNSTYEWIDFVSFGGMTNSTGNDGGYKDYTNKVANVSPGSTEQLLISAGFRSNSYTEHWAVWIDFNKDGTFTDNEKVATGSSNKADNLSKNISIPTNAPLGKTRMRVSMKWNAAQTACETFSYGEVEDYTVNITANINRSTIVVDAEELTSKEIPSSITTYPNPAKNYVQINTTFINSQCEYELVSVLGKIVKKGKIKARSNIDIQNLTQGTYFIRINDGQKVISDKLIKK